MFLFFYWAWGSAETEKSQKYVNERSNGEKNSWISFVIVICWNVFLKPSNNSPQFRFPFFFIPWNLSLIRYIRFTYLEFPKSILSIYSFIHHKKKKKKLSIRNEYPQSTHIYVKCNAYTSNSITKYQCLWVTIVELYLRDFCM